MANYNLFDAASLAMVPTGIKDGKLYSVKPNDGAGDFTFSRGTNLTATRVNADRLIEKGRENLLLQSNQFDTTWIASSASVSSGQSGYDGTSSAWLLNKSGANGQVNQTLSTSGVNTFSCYAKAGTSNWLRLTPYDDVFFDLANGVSYEYGATTIDSTITDVGGGWYRCSITYNATSTLVRIIVADSSSSSSGTSGTVYIQDAQLEQGLVATDYIETTTAPVSAGITENLPRIDYSSGCGSLLLEPERTNLVVNSEYSVNSWGGVRRISPIANAGISPEGLNNATKIDETAVNGTHMFDYNFTATSGVTYTFSYFAKAGERNQCYLFGYTDGGVFSSQRAIFDLSNGTIVSNVGNGIADIKPFNDGWYRVSLTLTAQASSQAGYWGIGLALDSATSYLGVASNGIYMYGFQHEAGSYPTSYIPTYGSAATRTADVAIASHNALPNSNEGVLFVEYTQPIEQPSGLNHIAGYRDNSNADFYILQLGNSNNHELRWRGQNGTGISLIAALDEATYGLHRKIAFLKTNDKLIAYCNGIKVNEVSAGSANAFSTNASEELDLWYSGFVEKNNIKQLLVFPTALTDNECKALTRPYDTYQEWVDGEGLTWESKTCTVQNIVELQNL